MAYANLYRPDRLFLPQQRLTAFAETVPTPFYLYHEEGIRKSAQLICGSFRWAPEHLALFPISANSCPQVLRIFREAGFGTLARSVQELALARSCGFSEIAFHTAAMTPEAVRAVKDAPCTVIFDSPAQIEAMEGRFPARCALRYHPEKEPGRSAAAVLRHKSGMDRAQILDAVRILSAAGVEEIGLHCHIDGNPGEEFYPAAADMAFSLAQEVFLGTGIRFAFVDPGGGIGLRREAERGMVQLSRVGALVRDRYEARFGAGYRPAIWTEFGRCAVARHGLLICRVRRYGSGRGPMRSWMRPPVSCRICSWAVRGIPSRWWAPARKTADGSIPSMAARRMCGRSSATARSCLFCRRESCWRSATRALIANPCRSRGAWAPPAAAISIPKTEALCLQHEQKRADADDNTDADDGCDKGLQGQKEGNRGRVAHRTDPAGRLRKIGAKIDQFVHNGISFHLSAPL